MATRHWLAVALIVAHAPLAAALPPPDVLMWETNRKVTAGYGDAQACVWLASDGRAGADTGAACDAGVWVAWARSCIARGDCDPPLQDRSIYAPVVDEALHAACWITEDPQVCAVRLPLP